MQLIGFTGKKRSGKDTAAAALVEQGWHRIAFADKLKQVAMDLWGLTWDQVYGEEEHKEAVDPRWGKSPRQILQALGTEVGRNVHPETWTRYLFEQIDKANRGEAILLPDFQAKEFRRVHCPNQKWVVPDVRFESEALMIMQRGGHLMLVSRPQQVGEEDAHVSEKGVPSSWMYSVFLNDSRPQQLQFKVKTLERFMSPYAVSLSLLDLIETKAHRAFPFGRFHFQMTLQTLSGELSYQNPATLLEELLT